MLFKRLTAIAAGICLTLGSCSIANAAPQGDEVSINYTASRINGNNCEVRAYQPYDYREGLNVYLKFRVSFNCYPVPRWILVTDQPRKLGSDGIWRNYGAAKTWTLPRRDGTIIITVDCIKGVFNVHTDLTNELGADHVTGPTATIDCVA